MRHPLLVIALLACVLLAPDGRAQTAQAPKARLWTTCDEVCLALTESIKAQPETLVMRLEDALVIRRECAAEIVAAAMNAVGPNRTLRDQIVQTALKIVPERSKTILYAARNHARFAPTVAEVDEEKLLSSMVVVRKAIIPVEEVRRAELPAPAAVTQAPAPTPAPAPVVALAPAPEVRRAIRITPTAAVDEIRRAAVPQHQLSQRRR
jgi:hypothetical protein